MQQQDADKTTTDADALALVPKPATWASHRSSRRRWRRCADLRAEDFAGWSSGCADAEAGRVGVTELDKQRASGDGAPPTTTKPSPTS